MNTFASYNELATKSGPIVKDIHEKLCTRITVDGGDYCVVIFGKPAQTAYRN
jgi:hypothetical protein